jgi:hypothetical protein
MHGIVESTAGFFVFLAVLVLYLPVYLEYWHRIQTMRPGVVRSPVFFCAQKQNTGDVRSRAMTENYMR